MADVCNAAGPFGWPVAGYHVGHPHQFDLMKYEYTITECQRKGDTKKPEGDGWVMVDWLRGDFTDEDLWRRPKVSA